MNSMLCTDTIGDIMFSNFLSRVNDRYPLKNKEQLEEERLNVEKEKLIFFLDSLEKCTSKEKVDAKIRILAKKMLFTENYLKGCYICQSNSFRQFIIDEWEKDQSILDLAKINFREICSNYHLEDEVAISEEKIPIQNLMKIVKICTKILHNPPSENFNAHVYIDNLKWHLLTKKVNGKLLIVRWSGKVNIKKNNPDFLGKGAFGIVQRVYDVSKGCFAALKIASTNYSNEISEGGILNEINKLNYIHRNKLQEGIQEPPYTYFDIKKDEKNFEKIFASLEKLYNGCDLERAITSGFINPERISKKRGLDIIESLLKGLMQLHVKDRIKGFIVHGDLKIDNILVEGRKGNFNLVIGDLGGSMFSENLTNFTNPNFVNPPFGTTTSERSFTRLDIEKLTDAIENSDKIKWLHYIKKRDFFSLGKVLWIILSGQEPFSSDLEVIWAQTGKNLWGEDYISKKYGNNIMTELKLILNEDPDLRPSKKKFLNTIQAEKKLEGKKRRPIYISFLT